MKIEKYDDFQIDILMTLKQFIKENLNIIIPIFEKKKLKK
jgi:hypothetical protein